MKKILICMLIAGAMIFAGPYSAMAYQAGEKELTLTGIGNSDESLDGTILAFGGSLGYFLTDAVSVAARQGIAYADAPGHDLFNGSTRIAVDYHLNFSECVYPYIGANMGFLYGGSSIDEQFIAGPEIGLKYFANTTTFIFGAVEYQFLFKDADEVSDNFDDGRFVYNLGIGFKW